MPSDEHHELMAPPAANVNIPSSLTSESLALGAALGAVTLGAVGLARVLRSLRARSASRTTRTGNETRTARPAVGYRYELYSYSYTRIEIVEIPREVGRRSR